MAGTVTGDTGSDEPNAVGHGWFTTWWMTSVRSTRSTRSTRRDPKGFGSVLGVVVLSLAVGYVLGGQVGPVVHGRMFPWVLGRSLGIASYVSLVALVALGLWFRHPWRPRQRKPMHPTTVLRGHVALAVTTGALVVGHVLALASDRFAGVGWVGAVAPGMARYRPAAVALGTVGLYGGIAVGATVMLAGSVARRLWLPVHRLAGLSLVIVWFHGVLAGTDTVALRGLYVGTGIAVLALVVTRYLPRPVPSRPTRDGVGSPQQGREIPTGAPSPRGGSGGLPVADATVADITVADVT